MTELSRQRSQGLQVPSEYEAIAQRNDGYQFPAHIVATTKDLPDGRTTVGFVTDLSERKRVPSAGIGWLVVCQYIMRNSLVCPPASHAGTYSGRYSLFMM